MLGSQAKAITEEWPAKGSCCGSSPQAGTLFLIPRDTSRNEDGMTTKVNRARLPLYAEGLEIPVCGLRRVDLLKRGDWILVPYADKIRVSVILSFEKFKGHIFIETLFYPDTNQVYPWRSHYSYELDKNGHGELICVLDGMVS